MEEVAWSYSRINTFAQCPKKYQHLYVLKDVSEEESESMRYGHELHKAAEHYIKDGLPLEGKFRFMQHTLDTLNAIHGKKHCEFKMGVAKIADEDYEPCGYFDSNIWLRTVADLLIINGSMAHLVDYKTGSSAKYADTKQLDLMAASVLVHFPEVQTVKSALAYVVSKDFIKKNHMREDLVKYMNTFRPELWRLNGAMKNGVWNAVDSPLCGWCPVESCEHWYKAKRK